MAPTTTDDQRPHSPQLKRTENDILRPFDPREFDKLPLATDQDPPYRPWWVIERA
jgi:hypothetical protein